jgi:hypothetical protein
VGAGGGEKPKSQRGFGALGFSGFEAFRTFGGQLAQLPSRGSGREIQKGNWWEQVGEVWEVWEGSQQFPFWISN